MTDKTQQKKILKWVKNNKKQSTISRAYNCHAVLYGDYCDVRNYYDVQYKHYGNDTSKARRQHGSKRADAVARAKVKIYRLVTGNVYKHARVRPIFGTYTFEEPITDFDIALTHYKRYIRRLKEYTNNQIRYVAVPQIQWSRYQDTGLKVWHFHFVYFNLKPVDFKINDKLWGQGIVQMEYVRGINNIGAYIAGYMTKKDFDEIPLNKRFYYPSRNLIQPKDVFHIENVQQIIKGAKVKLLSTYTGVKYTQSKYKLC